MTSNRHLGYIAIAIMAIIVVLGSAAFIHRDPPNRLTSGVVMDKHFDDDDSYYSPPVYHPGSQSCSGGYNGQLQTCYSTPGYTTGGYWVNIPPHWSVKIQGTGEDGRVLQEWNTVSEEDYRLIRVGSMWEK